MVGVTAFCIYYCYYYYTNDTIILFLCEEDQRRPHQEALHEQEFSFYMEQVAPRSAKARLQYRQIVIIILY
jgi:hypothetical protein